MKIAVTYENGMVFQHFGHTKQFKIYEVENGEIVSSEIVPTLGSGHGALAGFLSANGVNALICGGIGSGARTALAQAGIDLYPGVSGNADASVKALLDNTLNFNPDTMCSHHHGGTHQCGSHSCGEDKHGCAGN
jgi:predicted Fe-Mo cluster-binding NifX family protein